jgi:predicted MFS family arabinose efflux permease
VSDSDVRPRLLALGGLIAMASAMGIGRFIYTPILPPMAESLHLTKGAAGLIASANFVGYLAGALTATSPRLSTKPRAWLLVALATSAATTAAMAWAMDLPAFLALRFLGGAASAVSLVLASALVLERLVAAGRGNLSALHFSGVGVGITVSALLTWGLTAAGADWRAMWLWGGVLAAAGLVAVAMLIPGADPKRTASAVTAPQGGDRRLRLLSLAYGLFGFGYVITATFIVVIVRGSPAASPMESVYWLILGLAATPSVAVWVAAGRLLGVLNAFALACVVEAAGVYASVAWPTPGGLLLAAILLGGTFMGLTALGLIAARSLAPANARRGLAIVTSGFGVGQIVGPVVAGYGFDLTGSFFLPSMIAVAALVVGAGLAVAIRRTQVSESSAA